MQLFERPMQRHDVIQRLFIGRAASLQQRTDDFTFAADPGSYTAVLSALLLRPV